MSIFKSIGNAWRSVFPRQMSFTEWWNTYHARDPNEPVKIYALVDPRDGKIRYIGQSIDPEARLTQHRRGNNLLLRAWLEELHNTHLEPTITILEDTIADDCYQRERHWIISHRKAGAELFNVVHVLKPTYRR